MAVMELYRSFQKFPLGNYLFLKAVCLKAPYFSSIKPELLHFNEGEIEIKLPKRKAVYNHIGTVHAIAMCNLAELCGGLCIDSVIPKDKRWIPKGMSVDYLAKATTSLIGKCKVSKDSIQLGDNKVLVEVFDSSEKIVFRANINMYVSEKS